LPAIIAVLLVVGLAVAGLGSTLMLRQVLVSQLDQQLSQTLRSSDFQSLFNLDQETLASGPTDYVVIVYDASGKPVEWRGAPTLTQADLPVLTGQATTGQEFTARAASGTRSWRMVIAAAVQMSGRGELPVVLALPMDSVTQTTKRMVLMIVWIAAAVAVAGTVAGNLMVGRSLRPLRDVERTAAAIARGDLSRRVPEHDPHTEVGQLTTSLNAMLTQIEAAFAARSASEAQMRRFVSDASHELRTPLAAIRGYGELYRMGALEDPEELASAIRRMEDEATRMGSLVSDLLALTHLDEGRELTLRVVDLLPLAVDAVSDLRALDPSRGVALIREDADEPGAPPSPPGLADTTEQDRAEQPMSDAVPPAEQDSDEPEAVGGPHAWGDESLLRQVFANLIGNAIRHTPDGTPVEIAIGHLRQTGWAYLEVRDHGEGIPPDQAQRVFERFYRLDASRSRESGGSGLGLAIVASAVQAHGGRVEVGVTPGGGASIRVRLRAAGAPAADSEPETDPAD
jgi:two-component system OmpR family sensor kinase